MKLKLALLLLTGVLTIVSCKKESNGPEPPFTPEPPVSGKWRKVISIPKNENLVGIESFVIGSKAYFLYQNKFFQYDQSLNSWSRKADFPGESRQYGKGVALAINGKGYYGGGWRNEEDVTIPTADFWQYDPASDSWIKKKNIPFIINKSLFSIANKGYFKSLSSGDFYEYDSGTDTWTEKAFFAGDRRSIYINFSLNGKGYVCADVDGTFFGGLREYNPATDTWIKKNDPPVLYPFTSFAGNGKGYIYGWGGLTDDGKNTIYHNDIYEYESLTDTWIKKPDFGGVGRSDCTGFVIGNKLYIGFGSRYLKSDNPGLEITFDQTEDIWEYTP